MPALAFALASAFLPGLAGGRQLATQPVAAGGTPTAAAVQGDRDHSRNLASQFLTGCNFDCSPPLLTNGRKCRLAFLHVPEDWRPVQLHLDPNFGDFSRFFEHASFADPNGRPGLEAGDRDAVEGQGILFYAGEGTPEGFLAIRNRDVPLGSFSVGDGNVRYLFTLSCKLFAHGPQVGNGPVKDFTQPEKFDPKCFNAAIKSSDPAYVGNVFHSWGMNYAQQGFRSPLNPHLRLACGGSSAIGEADNSMSPFWHYFSNVHLTPADSFLVGLYDPTDPKGPVVPLCISRGDSYQRSGLVDSRFRREPLAESPQQIGKAIIIAYPTAGSSRPHFVEALANPSPAAGPATRPAGPGDVPNLPVLLVGPAPQPSFLKGVAFGGTAQPYGFEGASAKDLHLNLSLEVKGAESVFDNADLCVARQEGSGSVIFSWRPVAPNRGGHFLPPDWTHRVETTGMALLELLMKNLPKEETKNPGIGAREPIIIQIQHDSAPAAQNQAPNELANQVIDRQPGCLYARLPAAYRQGDLEVEVVGEGAEIFVKQCPQSALSGDAFFLDADPAAGKTCVRSATPLVSVVYSARTYVDKKVGVGHIPVDVAKQQALDRVKQEEPDGEYDEPGIRVAYRAAPPHCQQGEMYLVYRFDFQPKVQSRLKGIPPLTVEIPAHDLGSSRIEDTWTCAPERPD